MAREWFEIAKSDWTEGHPKKMFYRLEWDVIPVPGNMIIGVITAQDVLRTLRFVEDRGAIDTAHRMKGIVANPAARVEQGAEKTEGQAHACDYPS
ncbi:hypothetical protein CR161_07470 [Prosthecochloris sp. ZM]|nr:hypothetical protein CR161_07470 [Prosthecochloris sp. ZM]